MKLLLVVLPLILGAVAEAPYPASGFRPSGPAFELPQKQPQNTQQQYLPPLDPRRNPTPESPSEEGDVSVQGLPTSEQLPIFQPSPINGQQYVGPALQKDLKNLDESYRQQQYQLQQEKYREFERQRQLEAQANNNANNKVAPRQFGRTTSRPETSTTPRSDDERTTTEAIDLNEGESLDDDSKKAKVTVEVTKQNLQEYPGEFYLSSLAQLQSQPQFVPFQLSQLRAPLIIQPGFSQKQVAGYDAQTHFAALPSVLAQKQLFEQSQQEVYPDPALLARNQQQYTSPVQPLNQQQLIAPVNQYQPLVQPQAPQVQAFPQIQAQPVVFQPQQANPQPGYQPQFYPQPAPDTEQVEEKAQEQPQFVYQPQQTFPQPGYQPQQTYPQPGYQPQQTYPQQGYQPQQAFPQPGYQPQLAYQPQYQPTQDQQNVYPQAQYVNYPGQDLAQFQPQFLQPQLVQGQLGQQQQGQDAFLQSGLDLNQQGNGVEQEEKDDSDDGNQGATATAVATAFGTRTQPRVQYGVPSPRVQADPRYQTTTESSVEATTQDGASVAEATAVANSGGRRKSAKLRNRRLRPVFTLDNSGHLVLSEQN